MRQGSQAGALNGHAVRHGVGERHADFHHISLFGQCLKIGAEAILRRKPGGQEGNDGYGTTIGYFKKALSENALSNNNHYQTMQQLAQMLAADDKPAEALPYLDSYLSETHSKNAKDFLLKATILYQLERYAESVDTLKPLLAGNAAPDDSTIKLLVADYFGMDKPQDAAVMLEQLVAKNPKDKNLWQNLVAAYQQADQDAKAGRPVVASRSARELEPEVRQILKDLDAEGRWLTTYQGERLVGQLKFADGYRFISSAVLSKNVEVLSAFVQAGQK